MHARGLGAVLVVVCLGHGVAAHAQTGAEAGGQGEGQTAFSLSVDSDDRFRGFSLSSGRPTLSLSLAYDHPSGLYLGVSAIGVDTAHQGAELLGYTGYVGYAARTKAGPTWDVGVTNANVTSYKFGRYTYNYTEFYTGLIGDHVSSHLYVSPNYLGEELTTAYVDLDGVVRPAPHWRLFGHVGALAVVSGEERYGGHRQQYDLRAGVAAQFRGVELQLAWTTVSPLLVNPGYRQGRSAVVAGASYFF